MNEEKIKRYGCHNNSTFFNTEKWCKSSDVTALESELTRLREEKKDLEEIVNNNEMMSIVYETRKVYHKVIFENEGLWEENEKMRDVLKAIYFDLENGKARYDISDAVNAFLSSLKGETT